MNVVGQEWRWEEQLRGCWNPYMRGDGGPEEGYQWGWREMHRLGLRSEDNTPRISCYAA